ncbi:MAG: trypsin-like peptidase domain-containing protein [Microbacterium sp.]|nr:trypsin-like peptidase domain-containing protein [Microbacterium sp.]MCV0375585.1 trypsin-like peptidase domain-containing protein [Microbacterium sp.]MCV0389060.1 trypsin-like peptidase domain-containing protein [Microbacterium sp.]MCV0417588.1 trypsin-like peptidase domain-containing protein [Microbacterium sp.]MCV0420899.1 trypsin-like peptidase domain-containing protein [Microbacterium sp.]
MVVEGAHTMNEDNPQDQSAPASNDAVPSTEAAEVAAQSATDAAADNATPAPATPASAAPAPVTPASAAPAPAAPVHGHEMPSTFASQAPAAPVIAPVPQGYAAPAATARATATAQGAAFGIPTASSYTQPTQPLDGGAGLPGEGTKTKEQKPRSGAKFAAFIVAAALVGGVAGFGGGALLNGLQDQPSSGTATGPQTVTVNNPGSVNETTAVATAALPSVVTIEVAGSDQAGSGSGVIISDDGYVLTNTHVVTLGGAVADPTIRVTTSDGRIFEATVVGTDPIYDLAVIKLKDAKGLTPIDFADSSKLNVGDTAVALGAPLGLANSVTTGIVSALNRSIQIASSALPDSSSEDAPNQQQTPDQGQGQGPFQFDIPGSGTPQTSDSISIAVIQTDAAINHGNSGGALVNSKGELIGINVAIASSGSSEESGSIGIGFAIPSNIAKRVSDEIIADGAATHGLLGASVQDASSVQGATVSGAYIAKATDDGAAAAAGIQEGDVVTTFNGVPITSASDLTAQVRAAAAGSDAKVTYVRGGKQYDVEVKLGELAG